ncbi:MAG: hypothetical protein WCA10_04620 [Terracidiphilus sp.]
MIEKAAHASRLGTLHGHQASLPADVIAIVEMCQLSFVGVCVALQLFNALLDQPPELDADFKAFTSFRGIIDSHCGLPGASA